MQFPLRAGPLYTSFTLLFIGFQRTLGAAVPDTDDSDLKHRRPKAMKVFFLSTFAIFFAMSASMPSALLSAGLEPLQKELAKLDAIAQERAKLFAEFIDIQNPTGESSDDAAETPAKGGLSTTGLKASGLRTGGLVTGSLQSGSSGLTPESEWRKRFPRKPGQ